MGKKLTNNLGLKIGSVLFAAILWLLVTNINDPPTPVSFSDVPVKIINADLITNQGKVYEVLEDTDVIDTVTIMVPRSKVSSLSSKDNIVAIADMNNLTNLNTIQIEVSTNRYSDDIDSIRVSNETLKLNIEEKRSISIPLTTVTSGALQEGYVVGNITAEQNLVRVSGPESVISRIKRAEVNITVTGFISDISTGGEIKLYDEEGKEISKERLSLNINNVGVKVEILATKAVPLRFSATGIPAEGYRATGVVTGSPDSVLLAGKANVLNNLSVIEVPDTEIDINGATENVTALLNIEEFLPGNVELADEAFDGMISVTAYIEEEIVRTIMLSEQDIEIDNLPEGYTAEVTAYEEQFPIQIQGLEADVNSVDVSQLRAYVDIAALMENGVIEELGENYYDVSLLLNLPDTVSLRENITVRLNIKEE